MLMDTTRPIYIILRQSPDWANQTYADLDKTREFCRIIGRPETYIIDRVLLWDRTFRISFFAARQIMKEISLENFRSVEGATLVPLKEIHTVLDRTAMYLFTDDDDWYNPHIAKYLTPIDPRACDVVQWLTAGLGPGATLGENHYACSTNGYAVSGEVLLQRPGNVERVAQHFDAQATFVRKSYASVLRRIGYASLYRRLTVRGFQSIVRLPHYLSITNKHAASTLAMETLGNDLRSDSLIDLIRSRVNANPETALPEPIVWADDMVRKVNEFMEYLLRSTR